MNTAQFGKIPQLLQEERRDSVPCSHEQGAFNSFDIPCKNVTNLEFFEWKSVWFLLFQDFGQ